MLHFSILRTKRLVVQLKELSIGDAIAVASMPPDQDEAMNTAFLRFALQSVQGISDPALWTVQERTLAICHYLATVSDDGPDFAVGDHAHYSNYVSMERDYAGDSIELDPVDGERWFMRHLTGAMAEAIERLNGEIEGLEGRTHWLIGAMAAQLARQIEIVAEPVATTDPGYDDYLTARIRELASLPESIFSRLVVRFMTGRQALAHFFDIELVEEGIAVMPQGGVTENLLPARFPASSCIGSVAWQLSGKPD